MCLALRNDPVYSAPEPIELTHDEQRIIELEAALDSVLVWADEIAGSDFEDSDTLMNCLYILTKGESGRRPE